MIMEQELAKLFDLVVQHERNPDLFNEAEMKLQRNQCLIQWPNEAYDICVRAALFAKKHPAG